MDEFVRRSEDAGRKAALRIIRHPSTRNVLALAKPGISDLVPFELTPDQFAVADLALAVSVWPNVGVGWWFQSGAQILDPKETPPKIPLLQQILEDGSSLVSGQWSIGWRDLPEKDRRERHEMIGTVRQAIVVVAMQLVTSGAPVDPGVAFDLALLTQLTFCDFEGQSPESVVENLPFLAPYVIQADGRGIGQVRDGITKPVGVAAEALRQHWRSRQLDDRSGVLRDTGGRPLGHSRATADLQEHLMSVLSKYPTTTGGAIVKSWKLNTGAGKMLRELMGSKSGVAPPAQKTIETLIGELRSQPRQ
jgi:hypothetical protein